MQQHTLHEVEEALAAMDRLVLEELAFRYVKSHGAVCVVAGGEAEAVDHDEAAHHADDDTIRDRVGTMGTEQLASILGPAAWIGVTAHDIVSSA